MKPGVLPEPTPRYLEPSPEKRSLLNALFLRGRGGGTGAGIKIRVQSVRPRVSPTNPERSGVEWSGRGTEDGSNLFSDLWSLDLEAPEDVPTRSLFPTVSQSPLFPRPVRQSAGRRSRPRRGPRRGISTPPPAPPGSCWSSAVKVRGPGPGRRHCKRREISPAATWEFAEAPCRARC